MAECDGNMHTFSTWNNYAKEFDVSVTMHYYYNDVNNQQDATNFSFINLFKSALHVSGDKFAHPQEHIFDSI